MISAARSTTIAFRISLEERALIDAQAGALGVSNSEYSRRVIVGGARVDARARAVEKESGRAELWPLVSELQDQLAQARSWTGEFRREVQRLQGELSQWSDDVVAAASEVLAGDASAQVKLATTWSRVEYRQRLQVLPIVAALVSSAFEQVAGALPITTETTSIGAAFLERVIWLIEALDRDAGEGYTSEPKRTARSSRYSTASRRRWRNVSSFLSRTQQSRRSLARRMSTTADLNGCSNFGSGLQVKSPR
jgi:hypothetical protein